LLNACKCVSSIAAGISAQFSQEEYMVDESAGHVILKVTVNGHRSFPISVNLKVFTSSKFQPRAGKYSVYRY